MIRINLLPYRAARRQEQILQHIAVALGAIGLVIVLSLILHLVATSQLSDLQNEYGNLRAQNVALQKKIGKIRNLDNLRKDVEKKLQLVDRLQAGRFRSLKTLHDLARVIPENVWLTQVANAGDEIKLSGLGESNKAVANFMRALDQSPLFSNVRLQVISRTTVENVPVRNFDLSLSRVDEIGDGKNAKGSKGKKS
ncbi:MAG: PilN domain-containing protein [Mariprofundaceae bacterium]